MSDRLIGSDDPRLLDLHRDVPADAESLPVITYVLDEAVPDGYARFKAGVDALANRFASVVSGKARCASCGGQMSLDLADSDVRLAQAICKDCAYTVTLDRIPSESGSLPVRIGRYRVISRLGSGGQAEVFRVVHPILEQDLVLKIGYDVVERSDVTRSHLVAEGKTLALLEHSHMARIVDVDFHEDRPFIVMQFVHGRSLRQHLAERKFEPMEAASLVAKIARALLPAHAEGILHRDIKPDNILIDRSGEPMIIDFGLARVRHAWHEDMDLEGVISGTIQYMPPEQARGEIDRYGPPTDIFALGTVLYHLLTGRPPYQHHDRRTMLLDAQQCKFDSGLLTEADIPTSLSRLCLKAMAVEPKDRFATAEEFAEELEKVSIPRRTYLLAGSACLVVVLFAAILVYSLNGNKTGQGPEQSIANKGAADEVPAAASLTQSKQSDNGSLQYLLKVQRGDKGYNIQDLPDVLPLKAGDKFRVEANVPTGMQANILWYDSLGTLHVLPSSMQELDGSNFVTVKYPAGPEAPDLDDVPGTELTLVVAGRRTSHDASVLQKRLEPLFQEALGNGPPPKLPRATAIAFNGSRAKRIVATKDDRRGSGDPRPNELLRFETQIETLQQSLAEEFEFISGIAFPHVVY